MPKFSRRKEHRPDEIVAAAFAEFAERGYADARLEQVARRAGVSKGLVFLYFKTKEHLFKAVVRMVVIPRVNDFDVAIREHDGPLADFLRGPFVELAAALPDSPARHVVRLMIAEGPKHPDLTRWYHEHVVGRMLAMLTTLLEQAEAQGEIRAATLSRQPLLLVSPVVLSLIWKLLFDSHQPLDVRALIEAHVEHLLAAVTATESA